MAVGMKAITHLNTVKGVQIGVVEAGIRYKNRKDLVVLAFEQGSTCAGVFTQNAFCAAPVTVDKTHLDIRNSSKSEAPFYFVVNTGNANAGTGKPGMDDANTSCLSLASLLDCDASQVFPFSTGVIGEKLPIDTLVKGLSSALENRSEDGWLSAAEGIMTTDTCPKGASVTLMYEGEKINITGICKGAGMIRPDMATMLGFIATDAKIPQVLLQKLLTEAVSHSFNRVTIDGDTSTNDSCMLVATGKSSAPEITLDSVDFASFQRALNQLFVTLAQSIVRDGEGATKFVEVRVESALDQKDALEVAYTVAHSPLVKTALFASDPNWGRILAAVGRAKVTALDVNCINIHLNDVAIVTEGGRDPEYTEERGQTVMDQEEVCIRIELGRGDYAESVWTSDLSHDYVTINADYRT